MAKTLTLSDATEIKRRLWNGETQNALAREYRMSVALIGNIRSGARWAEIKWPNGKAGALPRSRQAEIAKARKVAGAKAREMVQESLA